MTKPHQQDNCRWWGFVMGVCRMGALATRCMMSVGLRLPKPDKAQAKAQAVGFHASTQSTYPGGGLIQFWFQRIQGAAQDWSSATQRLHRSHKALELTTFELQHPPGKIRVMVEQVVKPIHGDGKDAGLGTAGHDGVFSIAVG